MEPPCPYLYPQLRLEHDLQLRKPGYLSIRERYTIPLDMLEHYNRKHPELRYRLTAKSFATVAKTFAMKIPRSIRSRRDGDSSTQSLCNVPQEPALQEKKAVMTHSEPDPGSERPSLAKLSSSYVESIEENDTTRMGPLLTSCGCKAMVSAGITDIVLTTAKKSREFLNDFRTRFYKPEA